MKKKINTKNKTSLHRKTNLQKAFTLIELLVVVAIISLLSAVVLNSVASARMRANDTKIAEDMRQFRKAAELYYNDNLVYPDIEQLPIGINEQGKTLTYSNNQKNSWSNTLAFFVKTVEAQSSVQIHQTVLCANFDRAAIAMVQRKYLASVPVHPYDDDDNGVCYKAVRSPSGKTFSGYGELTTLVNISNPNGGPSAINKRSGFVTGDVSMDGIEDLIAYTEDLNVRLPEGEREIPYPAGLNGGDPFGGFDELATIDDVDGITSGTPAPSCASGESYDAYSRSCKTLFTGTRQTTCESPLIQDPYSDNCTFNGVIVLPFAPPLIVPPVIEAPSGSPVVTCSAGYVPTSSGVCVSDGTVAGSCPVGHELLSTGFCQDPANPGAYVCPAGQTMRSLMGSSFCVPDDAFTPAW